MAINKLLSYMLVTSLLPVKASANDFWWPYLAAYESGPGSIRVNLGLKKSAPVPQYEQLVVTGVTYASKSIDRLPDAETIEKLNILSEKVISSISKLSPSIYVGTFTHNNEQLHYIYVKDSSKINNALKELYATACVGCKTYINIKQDPSWSAYNEFLYPNQETLKFYQADLKKLGFSSK